SFARPGGRGPASMRPPASAARTSVTDTVADETRSPTSVRNQTGASDGRPLRLPDHPPLAGAASRPPAALLAEHAERSEGLDHAGGDRPALRAAPGRHHQGRDLGPR